MKWFGKVKRSSLFQDERINYSRIALQTNIDLQKTQIEMEMTIFTSHAQVCCDNAHSYNMKVQVLENGALD